jgi:hypothetical protein
MTAAAQAATTPARPGPARPGPARCGAARRGALKEVQATLIAKGSDFDLGPFLMTR